MSWLSRAWNAVKSVARVVVRAAVRVVKAAVTVARAVVSTVRAVSKAITSTANKVKAAVSSAKSAVSNSIKIGIASGVALINGAASIDDIKQDISNYDVNNADANLTLDSKVFSSYKGTLVLRHDNLGSSFQLGQTIVLNRYNGKNYVGYSTENKINDLNHEWGHSEQERRMGSVAYAAAIGIPSYVNYLIDPPNYYSFPWERSADIFGGVDRGNYDEGSYWSSMRYISFFQHFPQSLLWVFNSPETVSV